MRLCIRHSLRGYDRYAHEWRWCVTRIHGLKRGRVGVHSIGASKRALRIELSATSVGKCRRRSTTLRVLVAALQGGISRVNRLLFQHSDRGRPDHRRYCSRGHRDQIRSRHHQDYVRSHDLACCHGIRSSYAHR